MGKKLNILIVRYLFITIFACTVVIGKGQNTSTPINNKMPESTLKIHSPHKATIYSALIPGLGQVYNKKYWKLPIIYGATGIFVYAFNFNNDQYNEFKNAYSKMKDGEISEYKGTTSQDVLLRYKDYYLRNRDLNVIVLAAIYMLNVLDATVDAHLFDYKMNEDLSLNIQPTIKKTYSNQSIVGISCSFSF